MLIETCRNNVKYCEVSILQDSMVTTFPLQYCHKASTTLGNTIENKLIQVILVDFQLFKLDNFVCTVSSGSRTVPVFPSSGHPLAVEISYPKTALSNAVLRDKAKTVAESIF